MSQIKKLPLTFLMTFGHCGIDWVHSLLDSHQQILLTPALSFYRCWKMLKLSNVKNSAEMFSIWERYINEFIGPNCKNEQKKFFHDQSQLEKFFQYFKIKIEEYGTERSNVFLALHEAYAVARDIDLNQVKLIVSHEHLPWPFEAIINDFPSAKILMITRDPRAAVAGIFKGRIADFGHLPDFVLNLIFDCWLQGMDMYKKYKPQLKERFKVLINEDMHLDLEKNMRDLARWLNIDFDPILLTSTYPSGKSYQPDTRYIKSDETIADEKDFYLPENVKKRWIEVLANPHDLLMTEVILNEAMSEFGYKRIYPNSFLNKIKGFLYFFLPNHLLMKHWKSHLPHLEEFHKIEEVLGRKNLLFKRIWNKSPLYIKFFTLILFSSWRRVDLYFFSKERWIRYDHENPLDSLAKTSSKNEQK